MLSRPLCALLLLASLAVPAWAADSIEHARLALGTGYHFSSGDYGESRDTRIHYAPLIARGELNRLSAEITLPVLALRGPSGIAGVVAGGDTGGVSTNTGYGEMQLAVAYLLPPVMSGWPYVDFGTSLKLPTASDEDLGTGELDVTPSLAATWGLGAWSPFCGVAYEILGDPGENVAADGTVSGFELDDAWRVSAGTSWQATTPLGIGLLLEYGTPTSSASGDRLDLIPFSSLQLTLAWSLQMYASAGLLSGSADASCGLQLTHAWDLRPSPTENP